MKSKGVKRRYLLEKGMATHSSILAWRIPWTEEHGGLQSMGSRELDMTEQLTQGRIYPTECRVPENSKEK